MLHFQQMTTSVCNTSAPHKYNLTKWSAISPQIKDYFKPLWWVHQQTVARLCIFSPLHFMRNHLPRSPKVRTYSEFPAFLKTSAFEKTQLGMIMMSQKSKNS